MLNWLPALWQWWFSMKQVFEALSSLCISIYKWQFAQIRGGGVTCWWQSTNKCNLARRRNQAVRLGVGGKRYLLHEEEIIWTAFELRSENIFYLSETSGVFSSLPQISKHIGVWLLMHVVCLFSFYFFTSSLHWRSISNNAGYQM